MKVGDVVRIKSIGGKPKGVIKEICTEEYWQLNTKVVKHLCLVKVKHKEYIVYSEELE